jgi:hypothetical protein
MRLHFLKKTAEYMKFRYGSQNDMVSIIQYLRAVKQYMTQSLHYMRNIAVASKCGPELCRKAWKACRRLLRESCPEDHLAIRRDDTVRGDHDIRALMEGPEIAHECAHIELLIQRSGGMPVLVPTG